MSFAVSEHVGGARCRSQLSPEECDQIDRLGIASGVAQFLTGPITSVAKLMEAPEQTLITVSNVDRLSG